MFQNNIQIQYEQMEVTPNELERRLFKALSMLINYEDIYEENKVQPSLED